MRLFIPTVIIHRQPMTLHPLLLGAPLSKFIQLQAQAFEVRFTRKVSGRKVGMPEGTSSGKPGNVSSVVLSSIESAFEA